jgi:hypothetical protein
VHICAEKRLMVVARLLMTGSRSSTDSTTTVFTPEVSE